MGVVTQEYATPVAVPPARLFKAMCLDFHNLIPKIVEPIQSIEFTHGDGAAGTIKKITILEGGESKYILHKVDEIDAEKFVYNFSIIGGTGLVETLEKVQFESQMVEAPNGGSLRKVHIQFFTKGDANKMSEQDLKTSQTKVEGVVKLVEAFLLANPDY